MIELTELSSIELIELLSIELMMDLIDVWTMYLLIEDMVTELMYMNLVVMYDYVYVVCLLLWCSPVC